MDGTSPLLTKKQREILLRISEQKEIELDDNNERTHRARLRQRIQDIITDFYFLLRLLPAEDRRRVFDEFPTRDDLREQQSGKATSDDADAEDLEFASILNDKGQLRTGVVSALAFMYAGVDDRLEFEQVLEEAIHAAGRADGRLPLDVDVKIEVARKEEQPRRDEIVDNIKSGDIDEQTFRKALSVDPSLMWLDSYVDDMDEE